MLEVMRRKKLNYAVPHKNEPRKIEDTIVEKIYYKSEVNEQGDIVIKRKSKKVNITALVNETQKLVKQLTAEEKLAEMNKIFTK